MSINGFVVARLPHLNYLVREGDAVPCLNGIYYAGIDRQRWSDLFDETFYNKKAPAHINSLAIALKAVNNDFSGIDLCKDEASALTLPDYSNRQSIRNELLAVRSPSLNATKGTIDTETPIEWIGFDFFATGEWSLIAGGLFAHPKRYCAWQTRINRFGLFSDTSLLTEYSSAYIEAADANESEPIAPSSEGLEKIAIEVGRVGKQ